MPKALFGTQRSPVQIRAARLETPGQSLRILRCLTPRKDWRGSGKRVPGLDDRVFESLPDQLDVIENTEGLSTGP